MSTETDDMPPGVDHARRRVLDTVAALVHAEGTHAVDLDRAGVPEEALYRHFRSKDDLVCAYLRDEDARIRLAMASCDIDPRAQIVGLFKVVVEMCREPRFQGCVFINVAADYPDAAHPVRRVIAAHRRWFRGLLHDLLVAAGHPTPGRTADVLVLFRDGLLARGQLNAPEDLGDLVEDALTRVLSNA